MTYLARLNRSVHHAARIRWYNPDLERMASIRAKAAMNNKRDGRALFTLG